MQGRHENPIQQQCRRSTVPLLTRDGLPILDYAQARPFHRRAESAITLLCAITKECRWKRDAISIRPTTRPVRSRRADYLHDLWQADALRVGSISKRCVMGGQGPIQSDFAGLSEKLRDVAGKSNSMYKASRSKTCLCQRMKSWPSYCLLSETSGRRTDFSSNLLPTSRHLRGLPDLQTQANQPSPAARPLRSSIARFDSLVVRATTVS